MKLYYKILQILFVGFALLFFFLAYKNSQLPFDENGRYLTESGKEFKQFTTVKFVIYGVLSLVSIPVWNKIRGKKTTPK